MKKTIETSFKRIETKYIVAKDDVKDLIKDLKEYVVEDDYPTSTISNIYFDTENFEVIQDALAKQHRREKIRMRTYIETPQADSPVSVSYTHLKGPAVRALRAQADKELYSKEMRKTVENQENLTLRQTMIDEILVENGKVVGVRNATHQEYGAKAVIVTTGTALRGEIIIGDLKYSSGPNHSLASINLADNLQQLGLEIGRFKTGTPPRVKA